jgi:YegS/Rv2252/BmrU family lipid kinase
MTTGRRALLLLNRGSRQGAQCLDEASRRLRDLGFELTIECDEHAARWSDVVGRHANDVDLVIVGGGDGSLNAAVDGVVAAGLPLGVLPLGTANDLARTLGLPPDLAAACQVIADGHTRRIDLGWVNGKHYFNAASLGLSVAISRQLTPERKKLWGVLAYPLAAWRSWWGSRPFRADLRVNGERHRVQTVQIVVANGVHFGGGLTVAADAAIDDEQLDLVSLEIAHWWEAFPMLTALRSGTLEAKTQARTVRTREVEIRTRRPKPINTDGEITARTPAVFRVVPHALAVYVPAPAPHDIGTS